MNVELDQLACNDRVVTTNQITLPAEIPAEIKQLTVTIRHPSVHIVSLANLDVFFFTFLRMKKQFLEY